MLFFIATRKNYCLISNPKLVKVNPENIPQRVVNYFRHSGDKLIEDGFVKMFDLMEQGEFLGKPVYIRYYVNQKEGDIALAVCQCPPNKRANQVNTPICHIEFLTALSSWNEIRYKIIFSGLVKDGINSSEVKKRLLPLFSKDIAKMELMMRGKPIETKANMTMEQAERKKEQFETAGLLCKVYPVNISEQNAVVDEILTTNSPEFMIFAQYEKRQLVRKPNLENPSVLYSKHRKKIDVIGKNMKTKLPFDANEIERISDEMRQRREIERNLGLIFFDIKKQCFRYTLKGALRGLIKK